MKQTSFLHQCLSLAGGTLVVMFISALTMPVITRLAEPSVYGQVTIFNTWCSLAVMVCSLGLDQTFIRFFYTGKTPAIQRRILSFCLVVPLLLCLLVSCTLLPGLIGEQNRFLILCFILALFVRTLNRMGMLVLRLKYRTSLYSAMSVLNKSLYVILVLAGMRLFSGHGLTVMIGASLAAMTACVAAELYAERTFWFKTRPAPAQSIEPRHLLGYGLPLMAACAVFLVFQATDRFCIRWFADYDQVGVYASAQSIMNLFAVITSTFQTLWLPRAIEHYERDPQDRMLYREMNRIMTVVMFLFGAAVLLLKDVCAVSGGILPPGSGSAALPAVYAHHVHGVRNHGDWSGSHAAFCRSSLDHGHSNGVQCGRQSPAGASDGHAGGGGGHRHFLHSVFLAAHGSHSQTFPGRVPAEALQPADSLVRPDLLVSPASFLFGHDHPAVPAHRGADSRSVS
ncbi:lipopolysaccharide biosynthesis protein [Faecalibaculum rodentium]|jgi:hypothetical protein|uniref:lipopolysaccharide biosynthesis protein n=1 Tax=Faecalibaculum rodentium TaxID=1702221 RepID=UPI0025712188|nr:lipopolysaccharide biosynthesis protein [Faecalibaculum rodentium]